MRDFRKQRRRSFDTVRFFGLCGAVVVVLALAVFSARAAWGMYVKFSVASHADEAASSELADLKNQYARMNNAVGDLSTPRGEEGEIRERFGVAKPGEGAIEIIRTASSSDAGQNALPQDLFHKILRAFVVW